MHEATNLKKVFIIGCPRSGTTWVQLLLAQHPEIATAPETQIFAYYLDHFQRQWRHEQEGPGSKHQGPVGLSRVLTEQEFFALCAATAGVVLDKIAARNPSASVIAEKSPRHALVSDFIRRVIPDAYFLHVLRDPRDTAASLLAAGRGWAAWAPKNAIDAARLWRTSVTSARAVMDSDRYLEIRYEALLANGTEDLIRLFAWMGIGVDRAFCEKAFEACSLGKLKQKSGNDGLPIPGEKNPSGFFRKGEAGSWRHELSRTEVRIVEHICHDLMSGAGYTPELNGHGAPLRVPIHDALQRIRESLDWQLQKLLHRI